MTTPPKREFRIYADEAWTHHSPPKRRYWCFFGGIAGSESAIDNLDRRLKAVKKAVKIKSEVKWSSVTPGTQHLYIKLLDEFFDQLEANDLRYRQFFTSREYVYVPEPDETARTDLDIQFRLYYQFLKHSFSFGTLPPAPGHTQVVIRLDTHSSQKHKDDLTKFVEELPSKLELPRTTFKVKFVPSHHHLVLQACDVVMGAAGSYGNKMHESRSAGQRGQTKRQKARYKVARHIYERIRTLDKKERGTSAFNWFETTGGTRRWNDSLRIWKFRPSRYQLDKGWQNDHLIKGEYQGPNIQPTIYDSRGQPISE